MKGLALALTRPIWAIAQTEWRVTWRGLGLRLALLLVALPCAAITLVPERHITPWTDDGGLGTLTFMTPFAALLVALVIVPSYHREQTLHLADLVWARPLTGLSYLAGKILGAALVMGVILIEITGLVVLAQLRGGGAVGLPLVAGVMFAAGPALLFTAVLCAVCSVLLPHPLLGDLVLLVFCSLFGFFLTQSMVFLWNPWAQSLSYSRFLGFTLDGPLLLANRLFYAGLLLALVGSALLLFARRDGRALASRGQGRTAVALLALGALAAGVALPWFQSAVAAVTPSGPVAAPPAAALAIRDYRLDLWLDPATGALQGTARFLTTNDGPAPVVQIPLYLNDGLRVRAAWVDGHAVSLRQAALFPTLTLTRPLDPGRRITVQVVYAGTYKLLRAQYATDRLGLVGRATDFLPPLHPSLVNAGLAVLYRDGDWYPLPWTRAATSWSPAPLGWHALRIVILAGPTVLASTRDRHEHGGTQVLTWTLRGSLPTAMLAALPPSYTHLAIPGGDLYAPAWDARDLRARYGPYVSAQRDLRAFFAQPVAPVTVVVVPPSQATGVRIALGEGLALVPANSLDQTPGGAAVVISRLAPPAPYRAALSDLSIAWWSDHLPSGSSPTTISPSSALPTGYVSMADGDMVMGFDRSQMLAGYTGAAVAARRLGATFYRREMALRRGAATLAQHDQRNQAQVLLQRGEGPLAATMRALGLAGRLGVPDATPALDDLRQEIGADRLRRVLSDLAATRRTPLDVNTVTCTLAHATGQPVAALVRRYLGPGALTTGGCP